MFVDDEVLHHYRSHFPLDVIPFVRSSPASDRFRHIDAVRAFSRALQERGAKRRREYRDRSVTLVTAGGPAVSQTADALMDVLRGKAYEPQQITPKQLPDALDDVALLESILTSEMCVFLLDEQVSYADVLLAMAYDGRRALSNFGIRTTDLH